MGQFPLYIPSKGRFDTMLTSRALERMGVKHNIVVEAQERDKYLKAAGPNARVLVLDKSYQDRYDTFDNLGDSKSKGPGAARNFAWDHSVADGHKWHWVMDDNIITFHRLNNNIKVPCSNPSFWSAMEDFCLRYTNVAMAGPNYYMFVPRKVKVPPFVTNTRIYSCNLIRNDVPFRWRGRYNEDTDISLRMLKAGWCTIQFNAFLQKKTTTQKIKGGNTEAFYAKEGTYNKSKMQIDMHPDVSKMVWRFGRCHHHVDYKPFRKTKLKRRQDISTNAPVNNYGMELNIKTK